MPTYATAYSSATSTSTSWYASLYQNKTLYGTWGNDVLNGAYGNDSLYGFDGHDNLSGGAGNDWLDGGNGDDWLYGGTGHDTIVGGSGNDVLSGEAGVDYLYGGEHTDRLWGGADMDYLSGGSGGDYFFFSMPWASNSTLGDSLAQTGRADYITDWSTADIIVGGRSGYAEFAADVYSIEDAQWWANTYQAVGWLPGNPDNVFVYNQQTDTGFLLMDVDGDAYNYFESGAILPGAGSAWDMSAANFYFW